MLASNNYAQNIFHLKLIKIVKVLILDQSPSFRMISVIVSGSIGNRVQLQD